MEDVKTTPTLSICIPTWNRAKCLEISLSAIEGQVEEIDTSELELYVSDNNSDDETSDVVSKFINKGLPITYNRNDQNIGAAANFLQCMKWASGKYVLLLGDDDILNPGAIKLILDQLRGKEYGIIHIHKYLNLRENVRIYDNIEDFFKQTSYWNTFISGSIFRKEVFYEIDSERYLGTHLLQMPFFLKSAQLTSRNLIINSNLLQEGIDANSNGGYNFFQVFVKHYLDIWTELLMANTISQETFDFLKKDLYINFVKKYTLSLLVFRRGIAAQGTVKKRKGFYVDNAWHILFKYYSTKYYFWYSIPWFYYKHLRQKIKTLFL